jgi:hypothetical protein
MVAAVALGLVGILVCLRGDVLLFWVSFDNGIFCTALENRSRSYRPERPGLLEQGRCEVPSLFQAWLCPVRGQLIFL